MTANLRFFLTGVAATVSVLAVAFGGGALLANSMAKGGKDSHPVTRAERQSTAPVARVALAASSEPALSSGPTDQTQEVHPSPSTEVKKPSVQPEIPAVQNTPAIQNAPVAQSNPVVQNIETSSIEGRPRTRRELRLEQRRLRSQQRAERRELRHLYREQRQVYLRAQVPNRDGAVVLDADDDSDLR
jgi:hypothetical protein